jgi:hypothetical protein
MLPNHDLFIKKLDLTWPQLSKNSKCYILVERRKGKKPEKEKARNKKINKDRKIER